MALVRVKVIIMRVVMALLLLERMKMMLYAVGYTRNIRIAGLDSCALEGVGVVLRERRVIRVDVSESVHLARLQIK